MFESLVDRFFAADAGLSRLRLAARTVLAVALAVLVQSIAGFAVPTLMLGAVSAMISSTSLRQGSTGQRALNLALYFPVMGVSLTVATFLAPHLIVGDIVFLVVMFLAVYVRRFDQLGLSLGMGAFMAFFFALFLKSAPATLPMSYLAVAIGLASSALMALLIVHDTPSRTLRRTATSLRAQLSRLIEELAELLEDGAEVTEGELPKAAHRQVMRMHESTLQIEDNTEELSERIQPQWQRQLVDAELAADRLARATVRALGDDLDQPTRSKLAADLRGLHRFVDRDPTAALAVDTDELLMRIARYDIRGDPSLQPSDPEHHTLLLHRAIRELLLAMVQIRRTTMRALTESSAESTMETANEEDPHTGLRPTTRSAIQAIIGGALAIVGGELLSSQRWYWAVIAGFVVFAGTTSRGDLLVKGWRRVWGTLAGILVGTVLATLLSGNLAVNLVVLLVCIFFAFYSLRVSYGLMTFFITMMLGMLYDILGTFTPDLLLLRLAETAVGVAGSGIAAMLILPARTRSTVLDAQHDYFSALHRQLESAQQFLVYREPADLLAATREVDRAAGDVRKAIEPLRHRMSPARERRGSATRLLTLTEESAFAARNLARAAESGSLAGMPSAIRTLHRLITNVQTLAEASTTSTVNVSLESGPALAPRVDVRALAAANSSGMPGRVEVLHLRRTINWLDRIDELLLGMAGPLALTVAIPRDRAHRTDTHPANRG